MNGDPVPQDDSADTTPLKDPIQCGDADPSGANGGVVRYCYDEFDRMITARGAGVTDPENYVYDGFDRRDKRTVRVNGNDVTRDYSYVGTSSLLSRETDGDGKVKTYDYDSDGRRLGQSTKDPSHDSSTPLPGCKPASSGPNSDTCYRSYAVDANGSVDGLEDYKGTFGAGDDDTYLYDPYGDNEKAPGSGPGADAPDAGLSDATKDNPFRYEGFYFDSGVKTYDMQARAYRPDVGRFLSQDRYEAAVGDQALQSDPLTQNRYAFAGGNPINDVEFDGHHAPSCESCPGGGPAIPVGTSGTGSTGSQEVQHAFAHGGELDAANASAEGTAEAQDAAVNGFKAAAPVAVNAFANSVFPGGGFGDIAKGFGNATLDSLKGIQQVEAHLPNVDPIRTAQNLLSDPNGYFNWWGNTIKGSVVAFTLLDPPATINYYTHRYSGKQGGGYFLFDFVSFGAAAFGGEAGVVGDAGAATDSGSIAGRSGANGFSGAQRGGLNLFKWNEPTTTTPFGWREGDRMLHLPDKGSPRANWAQNSGRLRHEMRSGRPIYETYVDAQGNLIPTRGFLNAERNLLSSRGWQYAPSTRAWTPRP